MYSAAGTVSRKFVTPYEVLDSGAHAQVLSIADGVNKLVVKKPKSIATSTQEKTPFQREIEFFKKGLVHENLIEFKGFCRVNLTRHCILLPRLKVSLLDAINHSDIFSELIKPNRWSLVKQVIAALVYLHSHDIAHLDIKPENLMLDYNDKSLQVKLIDFGLVANVKALEGCPRGSHAYTSPEMVACPFETVDLKAVDMWSCAMVFYALLVQRIFAVEVASEFMSAGSVTLRSDGLSGSGISRVPRLCVTEKIRIFYDLLVKIDFIPIKNFQKKIYAVQRTSQKDQVMNRICELCHELLKSQAERFTAPQALNFVNQESKKQSESVTIKDSDKSSEDEYGNEFQAYSLSL